MNLQSPHPTERTWRDDALDESARGFNYENHREALMVAIRRARPLWCSALVNVDMHRALEFFQTQCQSVRSLLPASHTELETRFSQKSERPFCCWFEVEWQNLKFEVTFVASWMGTAVCLSPDAQTEALHNFAWALQDFCSRPSGRSLAFSNGSWADSAQIDEEIGRVTWSDITLPDAVTNDLRDAVEGFFAHREAIQEMGFAWKRGILLIGPPGTGKTMVCKAVAAAMPDLPFLYVSDFNGHNPIPMIFERARALAPCILAFEDIDGFLHEGNRTVFLNEMDGFASNEGMLIIASSNHPGKIDEALLKRPSRFDRVFHLGLPELPERRAFCEKILSRPSLARKLAPGFDVSGLCDQVAHKSDGFTPAYLKEAFVSAALSCAQKGATVLDENFAQAVLEQITELKAHLKKTKNPDAMAEMRSNEDTIGFRR
ncbi:putative ATPase YjoB [Abditibacteriota bacterium]|nr:putative ATPase YjoB [Abditibacteriota bacterium]